MGHIQNGIVFHIFDKFIHTIPVFVSHYILCALGFTVVKYNKLDMMAQTALNAGHTARNMQALNCLDRSTATATAIIATALTKKLSCISFGMPANII